MKKSKIIFSLVLLILIIILQNKSIYANDDPAASAISQEYLDWLNLSEEERKNTIEPFPVDIDYNPRYIGRNSRMKIKGKSELLPKTYDLREHIDIEVKNQRNTQSCWAFSSNSALETNLSLNGEQCNFSERHIEYATASNLTDGNNPGSLDRKVASGGNSYKSYAYYARGDGPILEEAMPFENNNDVISINDLPTGVAIKQVEDMKFFPGIKKEYNNSSIICKNTSDVVLTEPELAELRNEIKEHIMEYGGISSVMNFTNSYYNTNTYAYNNYYATTTNHVVTIIGWDDEYSRENFKHKPSTDGAYILLNSWGENWGDNGIFYVSYEDLLIERFLGGVKGASDIDYDNIYQYDTSILWGWMKRKYCANVFMSEQDEQITEIMVGILSNQRCNIYVNISENIPKMDDIEPIISNVYMEPGYNTVKLENSIKIKKGEKFNIIVEIIDFDDQGVAIENSKDYPSVTCNEEESYVSLDGITWVDMQTMTTNKRNLSIKAFTQFDEKTIEVSNLEGHIYNDGTGKIKIKLETSYEENEDDIELQVLYSHEYEDVTDLFDINGNKVMGKGANIEVKPLSNIKGGKYILNIKLSDFETISKEFIVTNKTEPIIEIIQNPIKMLYFIGEDLDLTGGVIIRIDTDETIQEIKMTDENIITDFSSDIVCEEAVTIKYNNLITYLGPVVVLNEENAIYSINVEELPKKSTYIIGENFEIEGLIVIARHLVVYSEGDFRVALNEEEYENSEYKLERIERLSNEILEISEFNSDKLGQEEITVTYRGKITKFNVTVKNDLVGIEIKKTPDKTTYIKGEALDITGGKINLVYENGEKEELEMTAEEIEIEGFDINSIGEKTITIKYMAYEINFTVYIYENELESQVYEIDNQNILNINTNTTISNFKENISFYIESYKIYENNIEVTDTEALIKTGQILFINNKGYELVVKGDINGDGKIKASDLSSLKRTLIGVNELTGAYYKAADLNDDGKIKASDLSRLKIMLIGE